MSKKTLDVKYFIIESFVSLSNSSLVDAGCFLEEVIVLITEDDISTVASDLLSVESILGFLSDIFRLEDDSTFARFSAILLVEINALIGLQIETIEEFFDFTLGGSERHALQD